MDNFENNLRVMQESIRKNHSKKVAAMLTPNPTAERQTHQTAVQENKPCHCRVCYWAKKLEDQ